MTYDILIQPQSENLYRATVLGWPDLSVVGNSEQTIIERIRQIIREQLSQGKVARIEIDEDSVAAATHLLAIHFSSTIPHTFSRPSTHLAARRLT
jgi:predicted RNase H-like HicB family nuclease